VQSRATARYLLRRLPGRRVAAVMGEAGLFGREVAGRFEVLRAFAPRAQGAPSPAPALETDILIATDLLSEGLNLQDAVRVIHYDLPWSPARLTQRVGRIDRAGSPHARIETITLLPAPPLAEAIPRGPHAGNRARRTAGAGPPRRRRSGPVACRGSRPAGPAAHSVGARRRPARRPAARARRARPARRPHLAPRTRHDRGRGAAARGSPGAGGPAGGGRRAGVARAARAGGGGGGRSGRAARRGGRAAAAAVNQSGSSSSSSRSRSRCTRRITASLMAPSSRIRSSSRRSATSSSRASRRSAAEMASSPPSATPFA